MKTIVVTGGAGFIGSNLCAYLLNKGENVICVDNFYTGEMAHIEDLKSSNFKIIKHERLGNSYLTLLQLNLVYISQTIWTSMLYRYL